MLFWWSGLMLLPTLAHADEGFFAYSTRGRGEIWRLDLDRGDLEQILERTPEFGIAAIAFNHRDQKLYWSEHGTIWRSNSDGNDIELVVSPQWGDPPPLVDYITDAHALAVDGEFLYWGNWVGEYGIGRLNLASGTAVETFIHGGSGVTGFAVDSLTGTLYWAEDTGTLKRANFDGSNVSVLANPANPRQVALDGQGFLYWADNGLYRSRLDGSEAMQIYPDVSTFALDRRTGSIVLETSTLVLHADLVGGDLRDVRDILFAFPSRDIALRVTSTVPGDFDTSGTVDAADYVVWRKGLSTIYTQNDYELWRANFGYGATNASVTNGGVPEPTSFALLALAAVCTCLLHGRRAQLSFLDSRAFRLFRG
jgi:hypothetical protein